VECQPDSQVKRLKVMSGNGNPEVGDARRATRTSLRPPRTQTGTTASSRSDSSQCLPLTGALPNLQAPAAVISRIGPQVPLV
jgi:hypothetical protein